MVVRVETPQRPPARETAGHVSRAKPNEIPRGIVTSFTREYMDYFAPLLEGTA